MELRSWVRLYLQRNQGSGLFQVPALAIRRGTAAPFSPATSACRRHLDQGGGRSSRMIRFWGRTTQLRGGIAPSLCFSASHGRVESSTMNPALEAIFGNRTAACVLLFLQCYGEGHALRIAKSFGFGLNMTQRQLKRLEEQGVLVSRLVGNIRLFSFNERNPTVRNLRQLLEAELKLLPNDEIQQFFRQRQLPCQTGKA